LFLKFAPLFVLMVLTLVGASGCLSLPVTSSAEPSASREPVVQTETAVVPAAPATAAEPASPLPTATADPTATSAATEPDSPLPTVTALATATLAPAATAAATVAEASPPPTPAPALGHYRGPNPYRAEPVFEVTYDPATWEYVEDDGSGRQSQLKHRLFDGCTIWLRAGPVDAKQVAMAWAADRAWSVSQVGPNIIQYVSPQDDFAWIFGILLPEPFTGRASSNCQDAAEQVIGTFKVVPKP
jgi:hypothetical protein